MIAHFQFDFNIICKKILEDILDKRFIKYRVIGFGEIEFLQTLDNDTIEELKKELNTYGISIIEDHKTAMVQRIKDTIMDMILTDKSANMKASVYLSETLKHSYGYLSNLFSEATYTSIESFIIMQKIERTKQLIINNKLSLTEIAHKLNYSSVAHLSTQFKNTTGLTPTQFQKIIAKRKENVR